MALTGERIDEGCGVGNFGLGEWEGGIEVKGLSSSWISKNFILKLPAVKSARLLELM